MAIYNSALCYEKAGEVDLAVARYRACADIEYQVPNVFLFISNLYRENGREAEAWKRWLKRVGCTRVSKASSLRS